MIRLLTVHLRMPEDPAASTSPHDGNVSRAYPKRQSIARTLGELGPDALPAVTALEEAAADADDPVLKLRAVEALYKITGEEDATIARLVDLLEHEGYFLNGEPAVVLADMGPRAAPAVPALISYINNPHWVETAYNYSTAYQDPDDRERTSPRARAARALGRIGKAAAPAVAALREALDDGDHRLRREAAEALDRISQ